MSVIAVSISMIGSGKGMTIAYCSKRHDNFWWREYCKFNV